MAKSRTVFECQACGSQFPKWLGRCNECGGWNTLVESVIESSSVSMFEREKVYDNSRVIALNDVDIMDFNVVPTGIEEFDHVIGGGLVPGSVTLIGGAPGIGKSTLVMQIVGSLAEQGLSSLYSSAEESAAQIKGRASRLGVNSHSIDIVATSSIEEIISVASRGSYNFLIVDSIHTVLSADIGSSAGTVSQVRECAHRITEYAKSTNTTVIVIGQVTKEGALAGPRVLEHVVDTVLSFDGDDHSLIRTLRANKHRFGTTEELGLFSMAEIGLIALDDPSSLMDIEGMERPSGLCIASAVDGSRPILVEVQALVVPTTAPTPRRVVQGVDSARVSSLIAVLQKRCGLSLSICDVYVSLVGGIKVKDAGLDLAICVAIASADRDVVVPRDMSLSGEVGLSGEIRPSIQSLRRIRESSRRGHTTIVMNPGNNEIGSKDQSSINVLSHNFLSKVLSDLGI